MKNRYFDLIDQTFHFPQSEISLEGSELKFHDINLMDLVKKFGTPLRFTYVPIIGEQIERCRNWFNEAIQEQEYNGKYCYSYCTKSSHFEFVLAECLRHKTSIETSSEFDINILLALYKDGKINLNQEVICNGFKTDAYLNKIAQMVNMGFRRIIPVVDNYREFKILECLIKVPIDIGLRIASEEEPTFAFYTSRLGLGYSDIVPFYEKHVKDHPIFRLSMLHFFVNRGIRDNAYYWNELAKFVDIYKNLIKSGASADRLNIGGGFPPKNSLAFDFDYRYMCSEIVNQIKIGADSVLAPHPDIYTEFGSFTVAESGGMIYSVLDQKKQNDREKWNMIDGSFMTSLPDAWAINKRFIMLPVNRWDSEYERVFLGGITCDSDDYYNSEQHMNAIYLPKYNSDEKLYVAFLNCGAYQESISGFGGIKHCLIPSAKMVTIDKNEEGKLEFSVFKEQQKAEEMLEILGY